MEVDLNATSDFDGAVLYQPMRLLGSLHPVAAFLLGFWYSLAGGAAMSAGVKYLHPESPSAHSILQSVAWSIGSGLAIALASRLSKTYKMTVGLSCSVASASIWLALLYFVRDSRSVALDDVTWFGHALSLQAVLIAFTILVLIAGACGTLLGARSTTDDEVVEPLLRIPIGHWLWLWLAFFAWVSILPIIAYYLWLQIATSLYAIIHPSLWFSVGSGLFFGCIGIGVFLKGVEISVRAVSKKTAYGGVAWKRILMFLLAAILFSSVASPFALNLDIDRMKDVPATLGSHPWWVL